MRSLAHPVAGMAILIGAGAWLAGCERVAAGCVLVLIVCAIAAGGER